ncbi:hypothetical protein SLPHG_CDS0052 [Salmonella phage Sephi301i]
MREQWNTKTTISKIINLRCDFVVNASCKRMQNKKNTQRVLTTCNKDL